MPIAIRRRTATTSTTVLVLLAAPLSWPAGAHQDRAELSRVQRKLDAVRRVLADARADANRVAAALVQADRDVTRLAPRSSRHRQLSGRPGHPGAGGAGGGQSPAGGRRPAGGD